MCAFGGSRTGFARDVHCASARSLDAMHCVDGGIRYRKEEQRRRRGEVERKRERERKRKRKKKKMETCCSGTRNEQDDTILFSLNHIIITPFYY